MILITSYCQTCDEWFERIEPLYGGSTGPGHEHNLLSLAVVLTLEQTLAEVRKGSREAILYEVAA